MGMMMSFMKTSPKKLGRVLGLITPFLACLPHCVIITFLGGLHFNNYGKKYIISFTQTSTKTWVGFYPYHHIFHISPP
jgi:hypothetical protein